MCSDSDLGPVTLPVRDQVLHRGHVPPLLLPHSEARPGPLRPAAGMTSVKLLTCHVPPRGPRPRNSDSLTHDALAANTHNKARNTMDQCWCTRIACVPVLTLRGAIDAMDKCEKRAVGSLSISTCIWQNRYLTLGISKGEGRGKGRGKGGGGRLRTSLRLHTQRAQTIKAATNRTL
jgi:hypothetical protein